GLLPDPADGDGGVETAGVGEDDAIGHGVLLGALWVFTVCLQGLAGRCQGCRRASAASRSASSAPPTGSRATLNRVSSPAILTAPSSSRSRLRVATATATPSSASASASSV